MLFQVHDYVVTYNGGTTATYKAVNDEDGLYAGLRIVPRPTLAVETKEEAHAVRMEQNFAGVEIPVTITRDDGSVIFEGVRRHPMSVPQIEGRLEDGSHFTWNP